MTSGESPPQPAAPGARRLSAILALDVAGYSSLAERDEAEAIAQVAAVRMRVEDLAHARGGRIFNTAGDGVLAEFSSAQSAIETAALLIEARDLPTVRIGVHVGEVAVAANGDLMGHAVNVAARLEQQADRGAALVSLDARRMVRGPLAQRLEPAGDRQLNKMDGVVECYVLAPTSRPIAFAFVPPPRREIVLWLAGAAVLFAFVSMLWSMGVIGPNREAMLRAALSDPQAMRAITSQVTAQLVTNGDESQETMDGAHDAVVTLANSPAEADRAAFSFLHEGETQRAVRALETFAEDLARRGASSEAAAAYARAGALALFHDKRRANTDFRRAYALDRDNVDRFAELMAGAVAADGYAAGFRIADEAIAGRLSQSPKIAAAARLLASSLAGDIGQTGRQSAYLTRAARDIEALDDPYLDALLLVMRGYLALGEQRLGEARALYEEGRVALAALPGHERDSQQGWLLTLLAQGDFDNAWQDGRAFIAERERTGAPPQTTMILHTCAAGVMAGHAEAAEALCRAGAQGAMGGPNEAYGHIVLGMQAAETGAVDAARAELDLARNSPSYDAAPPNQFYAARLAAQIAARDGDADGLERAIARITQAVDNSPRLRERRRLFLASLYGAYGEWALDLNRRRQACDALREAASLYRSLGGAPGAARADSHRRAARC